MEKNNFKSLSPIRYAGGKSKAVKILLENLPNIKKKKIVSPFIGGGSFEMFLSEELGFQVVGYDIFSLLVDFWQIISNSRTKVKFLKELEKFKLTEKEFTFNRHLLLDYWNTIKPSDLDYKTFRKVKIPSEKVEELEKSKVKRAVYYYYNMSCSYGPMFLGWRSEIESSKERFRNKLDKIKKLTFKNINVYQDTFENVLKRHRNDFLYLDPPYFLEGDSKMFKGIYPNSNFAIHHKNFNHVLLLKLLKKHRGGFLLSYNNCNFVKENYVKFVDRIVFPEWKYSFGAGETRIGETRKKKGGVKKDSHEILLVSLPKI